MKVTNLALYETVPGKLRRAVVLDVVSHYDPWHSDWIEARLANVRVLKL